MAAAQGLGGGVASYVVGVGLSSAATASDVADAVTAALASGGIDRSAVRVVATREPLATDPRILALGLPIQWFAAELLAGVVVANPSERVAAAVTTASVAEAAALLAAGATAELVLPKQRSAHVTVAIAVVPDRR